MFTNISWGNYITVITLVSAGWYIYVGLRYYFSEFKYYVQKKTDRRSQNANEIDFSPQGDQKSENRDFLNPASSFEETGNDVFDQIEEVIKRIKEAVSSASKIKLVKEEFLDYLGLILQEYPSLRDSDFRSSLNELIVQECGKLESLSLTQQEADLLWNEKT